MGLAYQEHALQSGKATFGRKFPKADHYAVAGDFLAWAGIDDTSINWVLLSSAEDSLKTQNVDLNHLSNMPEWQINLQHMHMNSGGILLMRVLLRHNSSWLYNAKAIVYRYVLE